jgi:hypothetical protein
VKERVYARYGAAVASMPIPAMPRWAVERALSFGDISDSSETRTRRSSTSAAAPARFSKP